MLRLTQLAHACTSLVLACPATCTAGCIKIFYFSTSLHVQTTIQAVRRPTVILLHGSRRAEATVRNMHRMVTRLMSHNKTHLKPTIEPSLPITCSTGRAIALSDFSQPGCGSDCHNPGKHTLELQDGPSQLEPYPTQTMCQAAATAAHAPHSHTPHTSRITTTVAAAAKTAHVSSAALIRFGGRRWTDQTLSKSKTGAYSTKTLTERYSC
jgi:hypothetical protein